MRKALVESAKTGGVTGDTSGSVGYFKRTPLRSVISGILRQHRHTALVSSATVLMLGGATVHAQVNPDTGQQGATPGLEEIVVSAQRRSETIQNVPYNISVLGGDALDSAAV